MLHRVRLHVRLVHDSILAQCHYWHTSRATVPHAVAVLRCSACQRARTRVDSPAPSSQSKRFPCSTCTDKRCNCSTSSNATRWTRRCVSMPRIACGCSHHEVGACRDTIHPRGSDRFQNKMRSNTHRTSGVVTHGSFVRRGVKKKFSN